MVNTMQFLERAFRNSIKKITPMLVTKMEPHTQDAVNVAEDMKDVV
ncbi:hypothetical protein F441_15976 [Phytophthora nicotianae CJ01A1]|uniref:Uncharacterized protein n=6 Tax=Phytophthora nicotianae TaxID=4792 RepID=W2PTX4_PHYN3|nr:hypothetical protein PPTG_23781 [Phytophthora nicotianae INRA-310]ETI38053.1 hypothetical protein F443_16147 [Phytophthora nicotianae P1569]ETK78267.1 hypothetical protein L915_15693 [Phytophthora nicotianae]ETO66822.1 hypothetical protein F444_16132 [Phytophthora nicotianae P1976]ETP07903.1 hypothetical protein F441_15976 [Phytophthora nicotianae CJ01A1]ETP35939.1 hypothetical protein F442_16001 [Phytophthora nicotianae P10297]